MSDTAKTETASAATPAAFDASDFSVPLPADATLADLVGRVNALTTSVTGLDKASLSAEQLSALNKITAFFSV